MGIHGKTIIHVVCETEEGNENNTNQDCYISDDFEDIPHAERAGWLIVREQKTYCPNCKNGVKMSSKQDTLLKEAIEVIKKHLADSTALNWTACHIIDEMKRIVEKYEDE